MIEIRARATWMPPAKRAAIDARLVLPFAQRRAPPHHARLASGEEVALHLPHGDVLRDGDVLRADDGRLVHVIAAVERVVRVECAEPQALARAAYLLGSAHVPIALGAGVVCFAADAVIEKAVRSLGLRAAVVEAPFEPDAGVGHDHAHAHDHAATHEHGHKHEHGHEHGHAREHGHDHGHKHDHDHKHDHGHKHEH
jgi:urease accessory protein